MSGLADSDSDSWVQDNIRIHPNPSRGRIRANLRSILIESYAHTNASPHGAARNPPESNRFRPSIEFVRIRNRRPSAMLTHVELKLTPGGPQADPSLTPGPPRLDLAI